MLGHLIVETTKDGKRQDPFRSESPIPEIVLGKTITLETESIIFCNLIKAILFLDHRNPQGWLGRGSNYTIYTVVVEQDFYKMVAELEDKSLKNWLEVFLPKDDIPLTGVGIASEIYILEVKVELDAKKQTTTIYGSLY